MKPMKQLGTVALNNADNKSVYCHSLMYKSAHHLGINYLLSTLWGRFHELDRIALLGRGDGTDNTITFALNLDIS